MRFRHGITAVVGGGLLAVAALGRQRIRLTEVAGHSMKPGLESGDYLVTLARTGTPARGDVIVVEHPRTAGIDLVKRAVGLPGETVEIVAGRVQIDGRALAEPWASGASGPQRTWTLGPREIFLLGDSRSHSSADGRTLGPTEVPARWWLARWRYWPPGRLGRI